MMKLGAGSLLADRFELESTAGSGGMGTVFRARDRYTGDRVALKLQHPSAGDYHEPERFLREAQMLSELRHPGIVSYVTHGRLPDGRIYLVMEWLDGEDLAKRLSRGPLKLSESIQLLRQTTRAIDAAHRRGIVHRDRGVLWPPVGGGSRDQPPGRGALPGVGRRDGRSGHRRALPAERGQGERASLLRPGGEAMLRALRSDQDAPLGRARARRGGVR
jgi:hypothetical protein